MIKRKTIATITVPSTRKESENQLSASNDHREILPKQKTFSNLTFQSRPTRTSNRVSRLGQQASTVETPTRLVQARLYILVFKSSLTIFVSMKLLKSCMGAGFDSRNRVNLVRFWAGMNPGIFSKIPGFPGLIYH